MQTNIETTVAEDFEVVSLDLVKKHLRVEADFTEDDDLIETYIQAAVIAAENYTGAAIVDRTDRIVLSKFQNPLVFESFPLREVESVVYFPVDGDEVQTMPVGDYELTKENSLIWKLRFKGELPETDDRYDAVAVTVKSGYEEGTVPRPIVHAVLLQVSDMYERREDRAETLSTASMSLLRPYKKF